MLGILRMARSKQGNKLRNSSKIQKDPYEKKATQ